MLHNAAMSTNCQSDLFVQTSLSLLRNPSTTRGNTQICSTENSTTHSSSSEQWGGGEKTQKQHGHSVQVCVGVYAPALKRPTSLWGRHKTRGHNAFCLSCKMFTHWTVAVRTHTHLNVTKGLGGVQIRLANQVKDSSLTRQQTCSISLPHPLTRYVPATHTHTHTLVQSN